MIDKETINKVLLMGPSELSEYMDELEDDDIEEILFQYPLTGIEDTIATDY